MEFLKANGIDDPGLLKETTYEDILNQQEIAHDELDMFTRREMQKEVGRQALAPSRPPLSLQEGASLTAELRGLLSCAISSLRCVHVARVCARDATRHVYDAVAGRS